jgi:phage baseplate assembly protein W
VASQDFLGSGVVLPLERDGKNDFANATGERSVASAVELILGTLGASGFTQGELPWRTDFGSLLPYLKHKPNNAALEEQARYFVMDALARWEPRIQVKSVDFEKDDSERLLNIYLVYTLIEQNVSDNAVETGDITQTVPL